MTDTFNYDKAAANLKQRFDRRSAHRRELFIKATTDCAAIVNMIIEQYNPRRIYQWGSLLHAEQFDENSDIDIAVEGIESAESWFSLTGKAMDMTGFPLDIVQIEHVNPIDRASIIENGRLVYERQ